MKDAHKKLKRLGCFKRVDGFIDNSNEQSGNKKFATPSNEFKDNDCLES